MCTSAREARRPALPIEAADPAKRAVAGAPSREAFREMIGGVVVRVGREDAEGGVVGAVGVGLDPHRARSGAQPGLECGLAHVKTLVTRLGATAAIRPGGGHLPTAGTELLEPPEAADIVIAWLHAMTG